MGEQVEHRRECRDGWIREKDGDVEGWSPCDCAMRGAPSLTDQDHEDLEAARREHGYLRVIALLGAGATAAWAADAFLRTALYAATLAPAAY